MSHCAECGALLAALYAKMKTEQVESLRAERDAVVAELRVWQGHYVKSERERDAAFAAGMRRAAEVCQNGGADWAYDLIITDLERLEE